MILCVHCDDVLQRHYNLFEVVVVDLGDACIFESFNVFWGCIVLRIELGKQVTCQLLSHCLTPVYLFLHLDLRRQYHVSFVNSLSDLVITIPNKGSHFDSLRLGIHDPQTSSVHAEEGRWQLGELLLEDYLLEAHHLLHVERVHGGLVTDTGDFAQHCCILAESSPVWELPDILDRHRILGGRAFNETLCVLDLLFGANLVVVVLLSPECFLLLVRQVVFLLHLLLRKCCRHRPEFLLYFVSRLSCLDLSIKFFELIVVYSDVALYFSNDVWCHFHTKRALQSSKAGRFVSWSLLFCRKLNHFLRSLRLKNLQLHSTVQWDVLASHLAVGRQAAGLREPSTRLFKQFTRHREMQAVRLRRLGKCSQVV